MISSEVRSADASRTQKVCSGGRKPVGLECAMLAVCGEAELGSLRPRLRYWFGPDVQQGCAELSNMQNTPARVPQSRLYIRVYPKAPLKGQTLGRFVITAWASSHESQVHKPSCWHCFQVIAQALAGSTERPNGLLHTTVHKPLCLRLVCMCSPQTLH